MHTHPLYFVLYLLALICFVVAAFEMRPFYAALNRINLIALGLFFWLLPTVFALAQS